MCLPWSQNAESCGIVWSSHSIYPKIACKLAVVGRSQLEMETNWALWGGPFFHQRLHVKELIRIIWIKIIPKSSARLHKSFDEVVTIIIWFKTSSIIMSCLQNCSFIGPDLSLLTRGQRRAWKCRGAELRRRGHITDNEWNVQMALAWYGD